MATFDIFNDDAFSLSQLSKTITDIPRIQTRLGGMGLFNEYGINQTHMMIERKGDSLSLVPAAPRGGVRQPIASGKRKLYTVSAIHLPQGGAVMADEVQGIRAFGSENEVESAVKLVTTKLGKMKAQLDLTLEYQRAGAIMGRVLDADGATELYNYYDIFGFTQETVDFDLVGTSATEDLVKIKIQTLKKKMRAVLGGRSFTGIGILASETFMEDLTRHASVKKAFELYQQNAYARNDQLESDFEWLNAKFMDYSGGIGTNDFIPAGEAFAYPIGVSGMFETAFAPGDYLETVNTNGLPYYAKQRLMDFDKGVELESQSNPLHLNSLPEAVFRLTRT